MRFELFVASRYLRAKRRQAVIGVITAISIIGVAAGVASLIIALAITNGFRQDLQQRLLGSTSDVNLLRVENDGIRDWRGLLDKLSKNPHVKASAPAVYEEVLVSNGARAKGVYLKGVLPQYERKVGDLLDSIKLGSARALEPGEQEPCIMKNDLPCSERHPPIILGKEIADAIGATLGSLVTVTIPQGPLTPFGVVPKFVRFQVAGIFQSGFYDYDTSWGFMRLGDAQKFSGIGDMVTALEFKTDDIFKAAEIARELEKEAGKGFLSTNWQDQNRAFFRALKLERVVTFITIGLIVFVAGLNILISLIMMVMEKTRDIAVLMSMGVKASQVRRIFILQGLLIGFIGTIIGLTLGYGLSWVGQHYRLVSLSPEVYSIDYVPFAPQWTDGLLVVAVSVGISLVATIYPSRSASRILPAEALRYE